MVSPAGYYAWCDRPPSTRTQSDDELSQSIEEIFHAGRGCYGAPRVHQALRRQGVRVARKRVARLMRQRSLSARSRRRRVRTTVTDVRRAVSANLLNREFRALSMHRKWVSDITDIETSEGWLYLAVVLDLYSRRVVGWSMQPRMEDALVISALEMALGRRATVVRGHEPGRPNEERSDRILLHSDRGSQYTSERTRQLCADHGIVQSMSRRGNCWDNAPSESFFSTLKRECIGGQVYATRAEVRQAIFEYIEVFYHRERLHSALGYCTPSEFEQALPSHHTCPL